MTLIGDNTIYSSSALGALAVVHVISPSQLTSFSSLAGIWREYRVVGLTIFLTPLKQIDGITYAVVDMDTNTIPTLATVTVQSSSIYCNTTSTSPVRRIGGVQSTGYVWKNPFPKSLITTSGQTFFQWMDISSTPDIYLKLYTDNTLGTPAVAQPIWIVRVEYSIQFRQQTD